MELIDIIFVSSIVSLIIITLFNIEHINHQIIIFLIVFILALVVSVIKKKQVKQVKQKKQDNKTLNLLFNSNDKQSSNIKFVKSPSKLNNLPKLNELINEEKEYISRDCIRDKTCLM